MISPIFGARRVLITAATALFLITFVFYLPRDYNLSSFHLQRPDLIEPCALEQPISNTCKTMQSPIPNTVHFVYILPDPSKGFSFQFSHFLSIYSAYYYWKPDHIYLHTNVDSRSDSMTRAKNGNTGKWNKLILNLPSLVVNKVIAPTHTEYGQELLTMEHKSDFVRVKAVHDFGGVYIDFDVFPLRDIKPLRESGYTAVGGRQYLGEINSGTFMAKRGSKLMSRWMERMNRVYDGKWTTHSNEALTHVGEGLLKEYSCEMLILKQNTFAPGSWELQDVDDLFRTHAIEDEAAFGSTTFEDSPLHTERETPKDDNGEQGASWPQDWSCTYMLHAFNPSKRAQEGAKYTHISPGTVLGRTSNFARAVYPVAKVLYDEGYIQLDDSDTGL